MKTALVTRLGGLGDIIIISPVARELKERGYEVDGCFGSPTGDPEAILGPLGIYRKIIPLTRHFTGSEIWKVNDTDHASLEMLRRQYDLGIDYKFSIELNSHYKHLANKPGWEWIMHQNSNYVNWYDVMYAYVNIDPSEIPDEKKRPLWKVLDNEKEWAKKALRGGNPDLVVAMQTNASSLTRTWYHPQRLPEAIKQEYPDKRIVFAVFDGSKWNVIRGNNVSPLIPPKDMNPLRASGAIVNEADLFIGADSGLSHVAEAVKTKSVTIYTTVPAWTRMKYYAHSKAVEPEGNTFNGVQCRPCFVLDRYCPRVREKALEELTDREKAIKDYMERNVSPEVAARELNTTPQAVVKEGEMMQQRMQALFERQAPCTETITTERIMEKVREWLV